MTSDRDPIVEAVRADLLRRSTVGITKYGVTLADAGMGLRDWLEHAYSECLDMANYLKAAIVALDAEAPTPNDQTPLAAAARRIIWERYDGGPPWLSGIPKDEWDAAVVVARERVGDE